MLVEDAAVRARDHKLTTLLRDAVGGSAKVLMYAQPLETDLESTCGLVLEHPKVCCSPARSNIQDSLWVLRACVVHKILELYRDL